MKRGDKMEFLQYLIDTFGYNEPILSDEISFNNFSRAWINKQLARFIESGELIRFEKGVYYIPKKTRLGPSKLNPLKVIEKKYIANKNGRYGYYSGTSFLNQIGLSTQVPNIIEIYTNNETAKVREVSVGTMKVLLRKSRTTINRTNVAVQSFLELMNNVPSTFFDEKRKMITAKYISDTGITRNDIAKYASAFPDKSMRTLVESQVIYDVTQ